MAYCLRIIAAHFILGGGLLLVGTSHSAERLYYIDANRVPAGYAVYRGSPEASRIILLPLNMRLQRTSEGGVRWGVNYARERNGGRLAAAVITGTVQLYGEEETRRWLMTELQKVYGSVLFSAAGPIRYVLLLSYFNKDANKFVSVDLQSGVTTAEGSITFSKDLGELLPTSTLKGIFGSQELVGSLVLRFDLDLQVVHSAVLRLQKSKIIEVLRTKDAINLNDGLFGLSESVLRAHDYPSNFAGGLAEFLEGRLSEPTQLRQGDSVTVGWTSKEVQNAVNAIPQTELTLSFSFPRVRTERFAATLPTGNFCFWWGNNFVNLTTLKTGCEGLD